MAGIEHIVAEPKNTHCDNDVMQIEVCKTERRAGNYILLGKFEWGIKTSRIISSRAESERDSWQPLTRQQSTREQERAKIGKEARVSATNLAATEIGDAEILRCAVKTLDELVMRR
jgi:hypothetical protein